MANKPEYYLVYIQEGKYKGQNFLVKVNSLFHVQTVVNAVTKLEHTDYAIQELPEEIARKVGKPMGVIATLDRSFIERRFRDYLGRLENEVGLSLGANWYRELCSLLDVFFPEKSKHDRWVEVPQKPTCEHKPNKPYGSSAECVHCGVQLKRKYVIA